MAAPILFAISGSCDFLRRRQVELTISKQRSNGWDVQVVSGSDFGGFNSAVNRSASIFDDGRPMLVVVNNPELMTLSALEAYANSSDPALAILVVVDGDPKGNTKFGKFINGLNKKSHQAFPMPDKKWEIPKFAIQFCVDESRRLGKPMTDELASALVKTSGTDLGFLSFEMQKAAIYADSHGADTIGVLDIKATMALINEASFDIIKDALVTKNTKAVIGALDRIRRLSKDPIMLICGFIESILIGSKIIKDNGAIPFGWLHLTVMVSKGFTPDHIADEFGINQYRCKNFLLPEVAAWRPHSVIQLLKSTAAARRALVSGQVDPWLVLTTGLINTCNNK